MDKGGFFKLSRAGIFLFCLICFIFGVGVASWLPGRILQYEVLWFGVMFGCGIGTVLSKPGKTDGDQKVSSIQKYIFLGCLSGIFLFLGVWRYSLSLPGEGVDKIWSYNNQEVTFLGRINDEADIRERSVRYTLEVEQLYGETAAVELPHPPTPSPDLTPSPSPSQERGSTKVGGKVLVTAGLYPRYEYGDELMITCELEAPEEFNGFAYDRYLARHGIYSVCYRPSLTPQPPLLEQERGSRFGLWFYGGLFGFKDKMRAVIERGLEEPGAGLAKAIILGDKRGIPDEIRENFSRAGISHIAAISGMHISIIAGGLMLILIRLGLTRAQGFYASVVTLIIYVLLIGLPASAMRASLMGALVLWALKIGRLNKITNALFLAGAILLLINPRLLRDDIGFQLSFLAVLGIVYGFPIFEKMRRKIKPRALRNNKIFKGVYGILSLTLAAQIFTMPILVYNFSSLSIVAPLANLAVLWTLPFLMVFLISAVGLSLVAGGMSVLWFMPARVLLLWIEKTAGLMASWRWSSFDIDYISGFIFLIYFLVLFWLVLRFNIKKKTGF